MNGTSIAVKNMVTVLTVTDLHQDRRLYEEHFGQYCEWEMACQCGKPACRKKIEQFPPIKYFSKQLPTSIMTPQIKPA